MKGSVTYEPFKTVSFKVFEESKIFSDHAYIFTFHAQIFIIKYG